MAGAPFAAMTLYADDIRRIPPELLAGQAKGSLFGRASLKRQSLLFSPRMSLSLGVQSKQAGAEEKVSHAALLLVGGFSRRL